MALHDDDRDPTPSVEPTAPAALDLPPATRHDASVIEARVAVLALDPPVALAAVVMYGQSVWLSRISAFGSLTAVTSITLCLWIADRPWQYQVLALVTAVIIWVRHVSNIRGMLAEARARKRAATESE